MRRFHLQRREDPSGVSGTGNVAEGVQFYSGQVALAFHGEFHGVEVWPSIEEAERIHGHGGLTTVEWED